MFALTALESEAVLLSLRVAFWSMLISLPVAIAVAWLLARKSFYGHALVNGLVHLPLVMPPVVVGYLLLLLLGRNGALGAWLFDWFGISVAFTWRGAAVASAVAAASAPCSTPRSAAWMVAAWRGVSTPSPPGSNP